MSDHDAPQDQSAGTAAGRSHAHHTLDLPAGMFRSGTHPETTTITMPKHNGPVSVPVQFTVVRDGDRELAIFEGDICLGTAEEVRAAKESDARGVIISGDQYRWPNGVIAYTTDAATHDRAATAIAHWQQHSPFRFVARTNETDYIAFEQHDGCWSSVGRQGGKQVISLGTGCSAGSAIHEIGHTLGLWHEQSRADRDEHITVVMANVNPQYRHNFDKHVQDGQDVGNYDYGSIMHYPATAFSSNGQPTIVTKDGEAIGQRNGLSAGDIGAIKMAYPHLNWAGGAKK